MLVAGPTVHYKLQLNELLIPDTVRQDCIISIGPLLRNSGARSRNYLLVSDQQRRSGDRSGNYLLVSDQQRRRELTINNYCIHT